MSPTNKVVVSMVILFILMCPSSLQSHCHQQTSLLRLQCKLCMSLPRRVKLVCGWSVTWCWGPCEGTCGRRLQCDGTEEERRWHSPLAAAPQPRTGRWPATRRHHPPRRRAAATTVRDTDSSDLQLWFFRCTVLCISLKYKMYVLYCYSVSSVMSRYECWVL